jgi:hypothetical protein
MSDFDKEAEREKLREKYEADRESREVAEKMSELLLQGATMTNAHCSECGDPIFRYDGQEFCATCERPVDRDDGDADAGGERPDAPRDDEGADGGAGEGTERIEVTSPSDDARVQFGADTADEQQPDASADQQTRESGPAGDATTRAGATDARPTDAGTPGEAPVADRSDDTGRTDAPAAPTGTPADRHPGGEGRDERAGDTGDLGAARASLVRSLTRFSQRAEAAEDPRRARDHLAAAREAAEALAALRR